MATTRSHGHCQITWYNPWPDSVPSPPKPKQNYIIPPHNPPPLQILFLRVTLSLSPSPLPPPSSQDSAPFGKHRLRFSRGKREREFLRHHSLGFPHGRMGILVQAAPGLGWAVDPTEETGMEGATQGSSAGMGKRGEHPLGHISPEGSSWFGALESEPPRDAEGRSGAGTPRSGPNSCPNLQTQKT